MRVLVTGANGFLGRHTVARLRDRLQPSDTIRALVRRGSATNGIENTPGVEVFRGSLNEDSEIEQMLEGVDIIAHVAAAKSGSPMGMFAETVVATEKLMNALERHPIKRLVLVSSFGVYGPASAPTGSVFDESMPLEPHPEQRDPYSWSKLHQEKFARERADKLGLTCIVLRPGVIYGDGMNLLSGRIGVQLPGLPVYLAIGKNAPVPLTHVDNCADAIALACLKPGLRSCALNIVDDETPTQGELLAEYEKHQGKVPGKVRVPYWAFYAVSYGFEVMNKVTKTNFPSVFTRYKTRSMYRPFKFSNAAARETLGWSPTSRLQEELSTVRS